MNIENLNGNLFEKVSKELDKNKVESLPYDTEPVTERKILDSGARREFASGAVRDIQEGKGRCDLLALDIIGDYFTFNNINENNGSYERILWNINNFIRNGNELKIYDAIDLFIALNNWSPSQAFMEVSKHYEDGAKKYAERNWEKGIPCHCYVDSGVRHFLKWIDKWEDEPHDRAFLWNMLGLLWTIKHRPECNDLPYNMPTKSEE